MATNINIYNLPSESLSPLNRCCFNHVPLNTVDDTIIYTQCAKNTRLKEPRFWICIEGKFFFVCHTHQNFISHPSRENYRKHKYFCDPESHTYPPPEVLKKWRQSDKPDFMSFDERSSSKNQTTFGGAFSTCFSVPQGMQLFPQQNQGMQPHGHQKLAADSTQKSAPPATQKSAAVTLVSVPDEKITITPTADILNNTEYFNLFSKSGGDPNSQNLTPEERQRVQNFLNAYYTAKQVEKAPPNVSSVDIKDTTGHQSQSNQTIVMSADIDLSKSKGLKTESISSPISLTNEKTSSVKCLKSSAQDWLTSIEEYYDYQLKRDVKPPEIEFKVLGYHRGSKTVYQFYDYDLDKFDLNNLKQLQQLHQLYRRILTQESKIRCAGYQLVTMWKHDWDKINSDRT